jgi:hypothetical protein
MERGIIIIVLLGWEIFIIIVYPENMKFQKLAILKEE